MFIAEASKYNTPIVEIDGNWVPDIIWTIGREYGQCTCHRLVWEAEFLYAQFSSVFCPMTFPTSDQGTYDEQLRFYPGCW